MYWFEKEWDGKINGNLKEKDIIGWRFVDDKVRLISGR